MKYEDKLLEILDMGERLEMIEADIGLHEQHIKEQKALMNQIQDMDLPTLLREINLKEFTMTSGRKVVLYDFVATKITDQRAAFTWLRQHEHDGIIKNEIKIKLGRGEDEKAARIMEDLATRGAAFEQKESVHAGTLKAFVTEILNNPDLRDTLPMEVFGVYESPRVKFK